jgi:hypothetical protein
MDIINFFSSVASLILAIISIWLSLYFYSKSKDTEKHVDEALTEIKTHAGTLERLTGKWMDRFTRYVTTPQPMDAATEKLIDVIKASNSQGNAQTGISEPIEDQILMYKEEIKPQFVKANITKPKKERINNK